MSNARIPESKSKLDIYIGNVEKHSAAEDGDTTRGEALGMTTTEIAKLTAFRLKCRSGDPDNPGIMDLHLNKLTKNSTTTVKTNELAREFGDFFRPILVRISGSNNIDDTDRLVYHIAISGSHSTPTEQMIYPCFVHLTFIGDNKFVTKCYIDKGAKHPALPPGANGVQVASRIDLVELEKDSEGKDIPGKVKVKAISSASECTSKESYSSASFIHTVEGGNKKDTVHFFYRWINTKHPERNAPWTGPITTSL